jgi:phosphonate transport system substrate-binding protein
VRIFVIFMMALGFFSIPPSLVMARELVYAPLPIENQATVVGSHAPMIQYLAEKLGVTIRIRYEKDNNRTVQLFKEGKIDLIQLGPLPYVTLKKEYARTLPLVIFNEADGKPFYTCALVTSFDGPPSVGEINSPLALTQFFSTCGHFSATLLLRGHHLDLEKLGYEYMGTHENVALAVIREEYKTGCLKTSVAQRYENLTLKILQETPPFPGFVIAGNAITMEPAQLEKIRSILMQTSPAERADWKTGRNGFSPVSDTDFDQFLRSMDGGQ